MDSGRRPRALAWGVRGAIGSAAAALALGAGGAFGASIAPLPLPTLPPPDPHLPAVVVTIPPAGAAAPAAPPVGAGLAPPGAVVTGPVLAGGPGDPANTSGSLTASPARPVYQPSADEQQSLPAEPGRVIYEQQQADVGYDLSQLLADLSPIAVEAGGGTGRFGWPVVVRGRPPLTQRFGCSDLAGEPYRADCPSRRWHTGIDLGEAEGTPVFASDSGVVRTFRSDRGYGNYALVVHGNGYSTLYGHLRDFVVRDGAVVQRGEPIGLAGSTGYSTGPHLHFEIRYDGGYLDPCAELRC